MHSARKPIVAPAPDGVALAGVAPASLGGHGAAVVPDPPSASPGRAAEDRRLLLRYHRHGDDAAREELVRRMLPLARRMARRYRRSD